MGRLEGKVCIVTGAARGLGRAFALKLADEGADVCVCDIDIEGIKKVAQEIKEKGKRVLEIKVDVSNPEDTKMMAQKTYETFGRIDGLVNNAALYAGLGRKPFFEIDPLIFDKVMQVNVKGIWLCVCAVFPYMKQQGKGKIVNLASEVAFSGSIGFAHYVASKGAVVALTRALANELGEHNICINAVAPGFIDTEGSRTIADVTKYDVSRTPLKRLGQPEDVVGIVAFLLSDEADFITGQTILVNGGRSKH